MCVQIFQPAFFFSAPASSPLNFECYAFWMLITYLICFADIFLVYCLSFHFNSVFQNSAFSFLFLKIILFFPSPLFELFIYLLKGSAFGVMPKKSFLNSKSQFFSCLLLEIWCILTFWVNFCLHCNVWDKVQCFYMEAPWTICWKHCFFSTELPLQLCRKSIHNM